MSETLCRRVAPAKPFMSPWDVITWIAFGEVRAEPSGQDFAEFIDRWGEDHPPLILQALKARASVQPHYLVQHVMEHGVWNGNYAARVLSPNGPKCLRQVRAKARRRGGKLDTFRTLADELQAELEEQADYEQRLRSAEDELNLAIRWKKVAVWAQCELSPGSDIGVGEYKQVPVTVFMNDLLIVSSGGRIMPDPRQPFAASQYRGPRYCNARFVTFEVLTVWPLQGDQEPAPSSPVMDDEVGSSRVSADRPSDPSKTTKLAYETEFLEAEYGARVARWKAAYPRYDRPSPADDRTWASKVFDHVPRQALRDARTKLAPESWKKSGPRTGVKWPE